MLEQYIVQISPGQNSYLSQLLGKRNCKSSPDWPNIYLCHTPIPLQCPLYVFSFAVPCSKNPLFWSFLAFHVSALYLIESVLQAGSVDALRLALPMPTSPLCLHLCFKRVFSQTMLKAAVGLNVHVSC